MRKNILSLSLLIALPGALLAGEAKILSVDGAVEARLTREGGWVSAEKNMEIAEGGGIRTGEGGGAVVLMPNKSKIWLKEKTGLEIEQRQTLASRLALVFGRVKVRVPHLMRREKFELRTPAAICAVRGTEFTMETDEDGRMGLQVLFGEVKMKFTIPPAKGASEFNIPQGQGLFSAPQGKANKPVLLTAKQERAAMENWNPGLNQKERQAGLVEKDNDRAQVKEYARTTAQAENAVKAFTNVVKESDLEAGRTLTDVHGNLVRVDQRLIRPDGSTIQFLNLVKRPNYKNFTNATPASQSYGFSYNGGAVSNRLDYMQMNMGFNANLPQRIEEWPSFFNSNTIDPTYATFVMAQKESNGIFFVAQPYEYNAARGELINNEVVVGKPLTTDQEIIYSGFLQDSGGVSAVEALNRISRLEVTDAGNNNGTLKYTADNSAVAGNTRWSQRLNNSQGGLSYSMSGDDINSEQLWSFNADLYAYGGNAGSTKFWLAQENYVIGNGGNILNTRDLTNSGTDPFTLLKGIAGQTITYAKAYNSGGNSTYDKISAADAFGTSNIDLVFIPDLMVAAVQRMLPAITNLGD